LTTFFTMATTFFHHCGRTLCVQYKWQNMKTFVQVFPTSEKNLFKTEKPLCLKFQTAGFKNIAIFG